ncbi:MAG: HEPN domain-containing protein [Candidatus Aenigmatarchaeota archaeon]
MLVKKVEYFSKTHVPSALINEFIKSYTRIKRFFPKNSEILDELSLAYIGARYLPIAYNKEKSEKLLNFVEKLLRY